MAALPPAVVKLPLTYNLLFDISNASEFVTYRNAVRQYAINPVAGYIQWPTMPTEVWTTV